MFQEAGSGRTGEAADCCHCRQCPWRPAAQPHEALLPLLLPQLPAPGSGCPACCCAGLLPLHLSEQYLTSSQTFSHFLRHVKGRPHVRQTLLGRSDFAGALDLAPDPFFASTLVGSVRLQLLLVLVLVLVL